VAIKGACCEANLNNFSEAPNCSMTSTQSVSFKYEHCDQHIVCNRTIEKDVYISNIIHPYGYIDCTRQQKTETNEKMGVFFNLLATRKFCKKSTKDIVMENLIIFKENENGT
jgi:hypothetical protein